jgi:hypothetical protein
MVTRLRVSFPLLLAGVAFWAGAWAASAGRIRVFGSPYPLWILLALNGTVAAIAGMASVFVTEADRPTGEDPEVVRVPRVQWESLQRRAGVERPPSRPAPRAVTIPAWSEVDHVALTANPVLPAKSLLPPPPVPVSAPSPSRAQVPASPLRLEMGLLELQGIARGAIYTGEKLGSEELRTLLDGSSDDLTQISVLVGEPRRPGEASSALLVRLLRLLPTIQGLPPGRFNVADWDRLAGRLSTMIPARTPARDSRDHPRSSRADVGAAMDELESVLRDLEPESDPAAERKTRAAARRTGSRP